MRPVTLTGPYVKGEKPGGPQNKHSREIVIGSIMNYESRPLLACQFKKITEGFNLGFLVEAPRADFLFSFDPSLLSRVISRLRRSCTMLPQVCERRNGCL